MFNFYFELSVIVLLGLCFGSFANVLIVRLPQEKSIRGRSECPHCHKIIPWYENIPLFSFFILKMKCSSCRGAISWRYPLVEFLMATLWGGLYFYYGVTPTALEYFIMSFGLVVGSFIDLEHMIIPDEITLGGCVLALLGGWLNPDRTFLDALLGLIFGGGILWLVAYVYYVFTEREGLGGGDIKLLGWLGALLSWQAIPFIILVSSVLGSLVGLIVMQKSKDKLKTMIPFGPFISLAALLYVLGLKSIGHWYINLFFPEF